MATGELISLCIILNKVLESMCRGCMFGWRYLVNCSADFVTTVVGLSETFFRSRYSFFKWERTFLHYAGATNLWIHLKLQAVLVGPNKRMFFLTNEVHFIFTPTRTQLNRPTTKNVYSHVFFSVSVSFKILVYTQRFSNSRYFSVYNTSFHNILVSYILTYSVRCTGTPFNIVYKSHPIKLCPTIELFT